MRLKELRKENKKKQEELAKILNITKQSYSRYEIGVAEPNIENLIKLADYYNVTLDYLVGRDFNYDIGFLSDNDKNILAMFRQLNKDNQVRLIGECAGILIAQK